MYNKYIMNELTKVISVAVLIIAMLVVIILLTLFIKKMLKRTMENSTDSYQVTYSRCRCMRQNNGNRGFCGMCGSDGTTFGCPHGERGCARDCTKLRYKGRAEPNCR